MIALTKKLTVGFFNLSNGMLEDEIYIVNPRDEWIGGHAMISPSEAAVAIFSYNNKHGRIKILNITTKKVSDLPIEIPTDVYIKTILPLTGNKFGYLVAPNSHWSTKLRESNDAERTKSHRKQAQDCGLYLYDRDQKHATQLIEQYNSPEITAVASSGDAIFAGFSDGSIEQFHNSSISELIKKNDEQSTNGPYWARFERDTYWRSFTDECTSSSVDYGEFSSGRIVNIIPLCGKIVIAIRSDFGYGSAMMLYDLTTQSKRIRWTKTVLWTNTAYAQHKRSYGMVPWGQNDIIIMRHDEPPCKLYHDFYIASDKENETIKTYKKRDLNDIFDKENYHVDEFLQQTVPLTGDKILCLQPNGVVNIFEKKRGIFQIYTSTDKTQDIITDTCSMRPQVELIRECARKKVPHISHALAAGSFALGCLTAYRWYRNASPRELCLTAGSALVSGLAALYKMEKVE